MSDSDDMDARVAALGVVAAPHEYPLDEIDTKRGDQIPSRKDGEAHPAAGISYRSAGKQALSLSPLHFPLI
jgi:hypothetical protein